MKRAVLSVLIAPLFFLVACGGTPQAGAVQKITLPGGASAVRDANGTVIGGGDIVLGHEDDLQSAANAHTLYLETAIDDLGTAGHGAPVGTRLWAGNVIPYTVNANLAAKFLPLIDQAVQEFASKTNIRLVKRSNQRYFVEIAGAIAPSFCGLASTIGFYSNNTISSSDRRTYGLSRTATHFIILNNSEAACSDTARTVIHEFGHILGLRHEHSRPDRDAFVRIDSNALNNDPLYVDAYNYKYPTGGRLNAYDYNSVMHYRAIFRKTGLQAIFPLQPSTYPVTQIGGDTISAGDVGMVNTLYPNAPQ